MAQITIYLNEETEQKMRAFTRSMGISQSKWVAALIQEKLDEEWPESIKALAGAWQDFPTLDEIRADLGQDAGRESV